MYLYKTDNFFHINHYLKSVSKVTRLHRFHCICHGNMMPKLAELLFPRYMPWNIMIMTYSLSASYYTPDIRSMWGYIVFAFPFVRSFIRTYVRSYVRSFVFPSQVTVFALKFIRPHILKTLWWISFIFDMMVDIGLKFLSAPSPPRRSPWGQGHGLRIFVKMSKFLCLSLYGYIIKTLFIYIWHVGRYRPAVLLRMILTRDVTEVKDTNLEFSYKSKKILHLSLYSHIIKTFY